MEFLMILQTIKAPTRYSFQAYEKGQL